MIEFGESSRQPSPAIPELLEENLVRLLFADTDANKEGLFNGIGHLVATAAALGVVYGYDDEQSQVEDQLLQTVNSAPADVALRLQGMLGVYSQICRTMPTILNEEQAKELMSIDEAGSKSIHEVSTALTPASGLVSVGLGRVELTPMGKASIDTYFLRQMRKTANPES